MPNPQNIVNHKFKKGQSGNPKGRPLKLPQLEKVIAEVLGEEIGGVEVAKKILLKMKTKALRGDTRAAEMLLDRAYGKPRQSMEHTGKDGSELFSPLTDNQVDRIIEALRKEKNM